MAEPNEHFVCQICRAKKLRHEVVPASLVRPTIVREISRVHADWSQEGHICLVDLNRFREQYVRTLLETEKGELTHLEKEVIESLRQHEILAADQSFEFEKDLTIGARLADVIARIGGSWRFIIGFACFLLVWIIINSVVFLWRPFDPYPFILLNLILSCLAAVQAPIIMMSQNRQEAKDRVRAQHDYQVNLKAELEIRHLHEKVDHLLLHQWERLVEIQQIQLELMNELTNQNGDRVRLEPKPPE
jgi:uncharacterized membrane protein